MLHNLFKKIEIDTLVLTPNKRLTRYLIKEYGNLQLNKTKRVWHTPQILPMQSWVKQTWLQLFADKVILTEFQLYTIWRQIIASSDNGEQIPALHQTSQSAIQAWEILQQWLIEPDWTFANATTDCLVFQQWVKQFEELCQQNNWLASANMPNELTKKLTHEQLSLPKKILLLGFGYLTPQFSNLLNILINKGVTVESCDINLIDSEKRLLTFNNSEREIAAMAKWASDLAQQNPTTTIACVVPNLTQIRNTVLHIFRKHADSLFDISIGKSLTEYPIINCALKLISLQEINNSILDIELLLHSPFIKGANQELSQRSLLSLKIKSLYPQHISLRKLLALAKDSTKAWYSPIIAEVVDSLIQRLKITGEKQDKPSYFVHYFVEVLHLFSWPGERAQSSEEQQTVKRWEKLLLEFCGLDLVCPQIRQTEAVVNLTELAKQIIFQPKTDYPTPINIMGIIEATGMNFDYLWVMGLTHENWPPHANPNPFIPISTQKALALPHGSAAKELQFSQAVTKRLLHSSKNITLSYAKYEKDTEFMPTPLLANIPDIIIDNDALLPGKSYHFSSNELEQFIDNNAPKVTPNEKITGGSAILKRQSDCPFRAFAEFRLSATNECQATLGLNGADRGKIVHTALENLWNCLKNQRNLTGYSDAKIEQIIQESAAAAVREMQKKKAHIMLPRFNTLEQQRLEKLLLECVRVEKTRKPFQVVCEEQWFTADFENINFNLRADRIDQIEDGSLVLIDYKTGDLRAKPWEDERLDEPQLPLYLVCSNRPLSGIVFEQVRNKEVKFYGCTAKDCGIPNTNLDSNWQQTVDKWRHNLSKLARAFSAGDAVVDPKKGSQTCCNCHLQPLCRNKSA